MMKSVAFFVALSVLGIFYNRYKDKDKKQLLEKHDNIIQQYLLSDKPNGSEPIIWIHIPNEINSRKWIHWGSRNTNHLNQPYLYLCIRSIINKAQGKFRVCIIDDSTFNKVLPNWNLDLNAIAEPSRTHTRQSLMMQLLYTYGGMNVPMSYIPLRNMEELYTECLAEKECFIGTCISENLNIDNIMYNINFMGSQKESPILKKLIESYNQIISRDQTYGSDISGIFQNHIKSCIQSGYIHPIHPTRIGVMDKDNRVMYIDKLMKAPDLVKLSPYTHGLYVPYKSLLKRSNFNWFSIIPVQDVLYTNTVIADVLLKSGISDFK